MNGLRTIPFYGKVIFVLTTQQFEWSDDQPCENLVPLCSLQDQNALI